MESWTIPDSELELQALLRTATSLKRNVIEVPMLPWKYAHWESSRGTSLCFRMNFSLQMHSKFVCHPRMLVIQDSKAAGRLPLLSCGVALRDNCDPFSSLGILAGRVPEIEFLLKEMVLIPLPAWVCTSRVPITL